MPSQPRMLRLNPTVEYEFEDPEAVIVKVRRGESSTRYAVQRGVYEFLERFREPTTLEAVARTMEDEGYQRERVVEFGKQLAKTPLIEFHDPAAADAAQRLPVLLDTLGFRLETAFKCRKFDGVFKVRSAAGDTRVLKLLHTPGPSTSPPIRRRLRNEFRILEALRAVPGVVRACRFDEGETPFFEMEFVDGTALNRRRRGTRDEQLAMAAAVAATVAGIHRAGVVHGDLHTSNFLARGDGSLALIDFDCAFFAAGDYRPRVGGAIHFLPPERVVAKWNEASMVHADRASDVYQAAVVIYSLLAGDMPYRGRTLSELAARIKTGRFRPLDAAPAGAGLPGEVVDFVHQALHPDPACRPTTMEGFPRAQA